MFRLQYELPAAKDYAEAGSSNGAKLNLDAMEDGEVKECLKKASEMGLKEMVRWTNSGSGSKEVAMTPLTTHTPEALDFRLEKLTPKLVFISRPLHTIEHLDAFLATANRHMPDGAYLWCHSMTAALKRNMVMRQYPWGIRYIVEAAGYIWHRVCPKLRLTHGLYFALTEGKNRTMSRVEMIGRLYRAGFEVVNEQFLDGEFCVTGRKIDEPMNDTEPTGSPIIHLRRIGKDGKEIVVHKFRTMYTYSEYIQDYMFQYQNLKTGGKFKDDYRINFWGRLLRSIWLDELPMVWNLLRGDIKLVGVRPLSRQYFNLYTPEMQHLRTRTKPGLLPPFYYEHKTPSTLDEIQESEKRYLEAYLKAPFKTDWKYFWGIVGNILLRKKHSA